MNKSRGLAGDMEVITIRRRSSQEGRSDIWKKFRTPLFPMGFRIGSSQDADEALKAVADEVENRKTEHENRKKVQSENEK